MDFFYCYDKQMMKFLRFEKGFMYNCTGLNEKTLNQFWQFTASEELSEATREYVSQKKSLEGTSFDYRVPKKVL